MNAVGVLLRGIGNSTRGVEVAPDTEPPECCGEAYHREVSSTRYLALRLVHLAAMAVWIGGPLVAVVGVRKALLAGGEVARDKSAWLLAITPIFIVAGLTTVASGIGLLVTLGGFAAVRWTVLAGAGVAVAALPFGGLMTRPALIGLRRHFEAGGSGPDSKRLVSRFLLSHRIEFALRVTALVLMVIRF